MFGPRWRLALKRAPSYPDNGYGAAVLLPDHTKAGVVGEGDDISISRWRQSGFLHLTFLW